MASEFYANPTSDPLQVVHLKLPVSVTNALKRKAWHQQRYFTFLVRQILTDDAVAYEAKESEDKREEAVAALKRANAAKGRRKKQRTAA